MAYEQTSVAVSKSQEGIRKLIQSHNGYSVAFISDGDPALVRPQEGFQAKVMIGGVATQVRIMATLKPQPKNLTEVGRCKWKEQEERRIWRVLFYYMKNVFEASDSGVMEFRELMLPFIMLGNGVTVAEEIMHRLDSAIKNPSGLVLAENN